MSDNPYAGQTATKIAKNLPKKRETMWEKAKRLGRSALGQVPTGIGVSTKKKGILTAKDTMMEE